MDALSHGWMGIMIRRKERHIARIENAIKKSGSEAVISAKNWEMSNTYKNDSGKPLKIMLEELKVSIRQLEDYLY
jgi:hypothetical protein